MKLAKIILPERDNDNQSLSAQHEQLRKDLTERWGGFTMTKGLGGWKQHGKGWSREMREPVFIYDVAMERGDIIALRELARQLATYAHQESVMIVTPNGDVEFLHSMPAAHGNISSATP